MTLRTGVPLRVNYDILTIVKQNRYRAPVSLNMVYQILRREPIMNMHMDTAIKLRDWVNEEYISAGLIPIDDPFTISDIFLDLPQGVYTDKLFEHDLADILTDRGISRNKLAENTGISRQSVYKFVKDTNAFVQKSSINTMIALLHELKVDWQDPR